MATDGIRGTLSFVKAVSAGSFAAAGRELGISAVAVSKNVGRLERELGVRLLQRSTRKLGLTEEGRLFYERCVSPLRELESARSAARERAGLASGTVRITSITPFGLAYVLPLVPEFTSLHPNVVVEFHLDDSLSDMISEGYDLGIRVGRVTAAATVARRLAALRFVVCGAPAYLAGHALPKAPADLSSHNCLRLMRSTTGYTLPWILARNGEEVSPAVHGNFVSNHLMAVIDAAVHGQGLAYLPLPRVLPLLRSGELSVVLPGWMSPAVEVILHYPSRRGQPARVKAFIDFVVRKLRKHADLQADPHAVLKRFWS